MNHLTNDVELEPYREVIDIMAKRIKKTDQTNSHYRELILGYQRRVERLEAALFAIKESPAYSPNRLRTMAAEALVLEVENQT